MKYYIEQNEISFQLFEDYFLKKIVLFFLIAESVTWQFFVDFKYSDKLPDDFFFFDINKILSNWFDVVNTIKIDKRRNFDIFFLKYLIYLISNY